MEWILYYVIGIFISLVIITFIYKICGEDYDEETVGLIIAISLLFPITLGIYVFIFIYYLIDKFIKFVLK